MLIRAFILVALLAGTLRPATAQMMDPAANQMGSQKDSASTADGNDGDAPRTDPAQKKAAQTFASKAKAMPAPAKATALMPLSQRERVQQMLSRFTFGPRPGEVDHVVALGADKWLEQQLNPDAIGNGALDRRLGDYPTLNMSADQAHKTFPDRGMVQAVADGRVPYPADPMLASVYEVQVYKWRMEQDVKKADGTGQARVEPTDAEKAAQKAQDQATAARIAGELFALPKAQRMAALEKMPVQERIAFTANGNVAADQRNLLLAEFTPREREAFQAMAGQVSSDYNILNELAQARVVRDVLTERQLQEVMTDSGSTTSMCLRPRIPTSGTRPAMSAM